MRIVYICQWNPWTLSGGALIRNYWLVRALASRYDVHLVTADDPAAEVPDDFAAACASISRFSRTAGLAGRIARLAGGLQPGTSFYTAGNTRAAMRERVRQLMSASESIAMIDLKMIDALGRRGTAYPFVYNAHNAEHRLFARRAEHEREPIRSLMRVEAQRVGRIEAHALRSSVLVTACSDNDRRELAELAPEALPKTIVVPNGVDTKCYNAIAQTPGNPRTVLITGSYDWRPNLIGLQWFLSDVLPLLARRMRDKDYTIRVAGRMRPDLARALNRYERVFAVPNPQHMLPELSGAHIVAAPILASSGTRLRILEAWASGRPVVTTSAGALGLRYRQGDDLLIGDRPGEFADNIARLLEDAAVWNHLRHAALQSANSYDWTAIGREFLQTGEAVFERLAAAAC